MTYLQFSSRDAAVAAVEQINANLRAAISSANPEAIAADGSLIGRNAASGALDPAATRTTTWAIPQEQADSTWVIPSPLGLQPADIFEGADLLSGVDGYTEIDAPVFAEATDGP